MVWLTFLPIVAMFGGFLLGYSNARRTCSGGLGAWTSTERPHWADLVEDEFVHGEAWKPTRHDDYGSGYDWPAARAWDAFLGVAGGSCINPATGLPMLSGDSCGIDVGGNPYGISDSLSSHGSLDHGISLDAFNSFSSGHNWL